MQLAPGIYSMRQDEGGHVHAFLLEDGNGGFTLIDTLFNDNASVVLDEMKQIGRPVTDIKNIILTHGHRSHIGGLATLKKLTNATTYSHEFERDIIAGRRKAKGVGLWPRPPLQVYSLQLGLALGLKPHVPCEVDNTLKDGDHVGPLEILSVPGHTPGCLAFYSRALGAVIAGDIVATWPEVSAGWAGLTLDEAENLKSVGKLAEAASAEILCVGHGEPVTKGGSEVLRNVRDGKQVKL